MKNNSFDKIVQEKLEAHEAPIPMDAWENIRKGKKKRRPLPWLWLLSGLLLCSLGGLYVYTHPGKNKTIFSNEAASSQKQNNSTIATREPVVNKENSPALPLSSNQKNKENHATLTAAGNKVVATQNNIDADEKHKQNSKQGFAGTNNKAVAPEKKKNSFNKNLVKIDAKETDAHANNFSPERKFTREGKTSIKITGNNATEDAKETVAVNENNSTVIRDTTALSINKTSTKSISLENFAAANAEKKNDTIIAVPAQKKGKIETGLEIDISISGFKTFGSSAAIVSVNRTMSTPMNKAEFTADKVSVRLQPSAGINLMLFKNLSAKTKIGAGLSYQHLKEYIQLNGQEINTNYAVVKRLQNGNALVDDTVKSVTRGIRIIDAVNSYSFISIPVALRYNVWQQKNWRFDLSAGIDINIESRYRNSIEGELMPQFAAGNTTRRNNSMGVGYNAAALLGRKMGSRYFIYAAPYIQLNPSKVYLKEMLSPRKLNRSGVSFGLSYGL